MPKAQMMKVPEWGRPHEFDYNFGIGPDSTAVRKATMMPIITYDEGLGIINSYKSNPQNANFVEVGTDHCYPTSRVNRVFAELKISMSKVMLQTDKVPIIRFATATIHTAFMDGELALDEVSTLDLNEILELQNEQTDRQTAPLYTDVKMADYKSNAGLDMPAETAPFLNSDLEIEAVAFSLDDYYDCLHYYTNGEKLKTICTSLQWHTLTPAHPAKNIYFNQQSNTKYLNPYTLLAGLLICPQNLTREQYGKEGDTTIDTSLLECEFHVRYTEFNHEFNHSLQ